METTTQISKPKALNIVLWVGQAILALMFLMAGFMKVTTPIVELAAQQPWVEQMPEALVRFIGISEILGALGLMLPAALRIKPQLTAWAAGGLSVVMLLATFFHASRGEFSAIIMNIILGTIAVFITWGRIKKVPISPR
jgi:putative oxidoreductase